MWVSAFRPGRDTGEPGEGMSNHRETLPETAGRHGLSVTEITFIRVSRVDSVNGLAGSRGKVRRRVLNRRETRRARGARHWRGSPGWPPPGPPSLINLISLVTGYGTPLCSSILEGEPDQDASGTVKSLGNVYQTALPATGGESLCLVTKWFLCPLSHYPPSHTRYLGQ